jgi:hypothetical protein
MFNNFLFIDNQDYYSGPYPSSGVFPNTKYIQTMSASNIRYKGSFSVKSLTIKHWTPKNVLTRVHLPIRGPND